MKKYKILVLSDLKSSTTNILKSSVSLAKMTNGQIEFFYVKKPTDILQKDNQLSAIRTINKEHINVHKKIQNIINPICDEYGIKIKYSFAFGNLKNEVKTYIKEHQPDIIVLGKRKPKSLNFVGDNITQFVLDKHDGIIMFATDKNPIEPNTEISLGLLNGYDGLFNLDFSARLIDHVQEPLKSFKIIKNSTVTKKTNMSEDKKIIEYVFEQNDNTLKNLSNYLNKYSISLLYVNRDEKNTKQDADFIKSDINEIINKTNVSLLITGL
ncbi:universal stress protein [Gaetbulibacter aquiaggeris]|uniref:Universal stress protein n=1 Tax=Gaetbulibacter aquiaggeris TaxID=1735373 RepID=A0ABW7MPU0_9FLAO